MPSPRASVRRIRSTLSSELGPGPVALLALMVGTGVIDAVCFLGLGRVFTANMTGNVALLGFAVAGVAGLSAAASATSLGAFLVGAFVGSRFAARVADRSGSWFAVALAAEAVLIAVACVVAANVDSNRVSAASYGAIVLLAGAMGLRNASTRRRGIPDLTSTVLTSTLTGVVADSRLAGGTGNRSVRRLVAVLALLAGAVAGALLLRENLVIPLVLAAGLTLAALALQLVSLRPRAAGAAEG